MADGPGKFVESEAWLWSMISSGLVALVLSYAIFLFPASTWKIALVFVVGSFSAEACGEERDAGDRHVFLRRTGKIPAGRRWAAQLGM